MAITDLFLDRRPKLGHIRLDCSVSESHPRGQRISRYPVESQADNADHVQDEADMVELEGLISDAANNFAGVPILDSDDTLGANGRGKAAWSQLEELMRSHEPFTVVTSLKTYTSMVFSDGASLVATRSFNDSEVLRFTARLEKYRTSFTTTAEAAAAEIADLADEKAAIAGQSTTPADAASKAAAEASL